MAGLSTLDAFLATFAGNDVRRTAVAEVVCALARASRQIREVVSQGTLVERLGLTQGGVNVDGDEQRGLDIRADEILLSELRKAPVAAYASEELGAPAALDASAPLAVAVDPLDGSSNIDANVSVGTIFSVLPALKEGEGGIAASFLQPGRTQRAAGFFVYGPQLALVLTVGSGTHVFVHRTRLGAYQQTADGVQIPQRAAEFAINMSNYHQWDEAVRLYVDDCLKGGDGPRERNFNMRWIASLVAEAYRILMRGGAFLYPRDSRKGYGHGRLRLVYEANPIAFLVEEAGGRATDGLGPILDALLSSLHQRTPLVFGSAREVARIARYHSEPSLISEREPLFGRRGLFRA